MTFIKCIQEVKFLPAPVTLPLRAVVQGCAAWRCEEKLFGWWWHDLLIVLLLHRPLVVWWRKPRPQGTIRRSVGIVASRWRDRHGWWKRLGSVWSTYTTDTLELHIHKATFRKRADLQENWRPTNRQGFPVDVKLHELIAAVWFACWHYHNNLSPSC